MHFDQWPMVPSDKTMECNGVALSSYYCAPYSKGGGIRISPCHLVWRHHGPLVKMHNL